MASRYKKVAIVVTCLAALLVISGRAYALDKKLSYTLSHYIMAVMNEDQGNLTQAIQEYKQALKADYQNQAIHLNLASSYIKNNNVPEAIKELNIAVKLDPRSVEPHALLALIYSSQNKPEQAATEYETALKNASALEPGNVDIYKNLGLVYLAQKKYKDARNTYEFIINLAPNDSSAHFYLADIYEQASDHQAAIKELKRAIELKADYHEALNYLGYLYVEQNIELDKAEALIKKALELEPDSGAYVDSLGWLYFKKGDFAAAIKQLERAVTLIEDPEVYDHLGDVYLKLNKVQDAKSVWEKSLKLDPKRESVREKINKIK